MLVPRMTQLTDLVGRADRFRSIIPVEDLDLDLFDEPVQISIETTRHHDHCVSLGNRMGGMLESSTRWRLALDRNEAAHFSG